MAIFNSYVKLPEGTEWLQVDQIMECFWRITRPGKHTKSNWSHGHSLEIVDLATKNGDFP